MQAPETKRNWRVAALYAGAVGALVLVGVVVFAFVVNGRVLPNTRVAGESIGFLSREDATERVAAALLNYESQVVRLEVDGQATEHSLAELGLSIDHERTLDSLIDRTFTWGEDNPFVAAGLAFKVQDVRAVVSIDRNVADREIGALTESKTVAATDAALVVTDGLAQVTPERDGFGFEVSLVEAMLVNHVASLNAETLVLVGEVLAPAVLVRDLEPALAQAQALLAEPLTVLVEGESFAVEPAELGTWLAVDAASHELAASADGVGKTVARIAKAVNAEPVPAKVVVGTDYVVQEGSDGRGIDAAAAAGVLASVVTAPVATRSVELAVQTLPAGRLDVGSAGAPSTSKGKEIVIVLSEQRLYAWSDGQLDNTYLISSGSTFPTHLGTFAVYSKIESHTMAGADYYLPGVPHSMYYDGLRAIHGAYWHNNFGQPMSHGCINEPLPEAEWLYNWTPMGTTVRVVE